MLCCGSGLASRLGRKAAPAISAVMLESWGRCTALSRHKAAPTMEPRKPVSIALGASVHMGFLRPLP
jgi:hypothetical protein